MHLLTPDRSRILYKLARRGSQLYNSHFMTQYKNATIDTYEGDGLSTGHRCEVVIWDGSISVTWRENNQYTTYKGQEVAPGHFKLSALSVRGSATLHRFPIDDDVLEGTWHQEGYEGMWRIHLGDVANP
jgi:hypothetical protein